MLFSNADDTEFEDVDEIEFVEIGVMLEAGEELSEETFILPPHRSCAAHLLNNVIKDMNNQVTDVQYKAQSKETFQKLKSLWSRQSKTDLDTIHKVIKCNFKIPSEARWNSVVDAVKFVLEEIQNLDVICDKLSLPRFSYEDVHFMRKYCEIMGHLCTALDTLQGEKFVLLGLLLPTLLSLRRKLESLNGNSGVCEPLRQAAVNSLDSRFEKFWLDDANVIASALHPFCKGWTKKDPVLEEMVNVALSKLPCLNASFNDLLVTEATDEMDVKSENKSELVKYRLVKKFENPLSKFELLDFIHESDSMDELHDCEKELKTFLDKCPQPLRNLNSYPCIRDNFLRYNTPVVSSAECERLFSRATHLFRREHGRLADINFENCAILNLNQTVLNDE